MPQGRRKLLSPNSLRSPYMNDVEDEDFFENSINLQHFPNIHRRLDSYEESQSYTNLLHPVEASSGVGNTPGTTQQSPPLFESDSVFTLSSSLNSKRSPRTHKAKPSKGSKESTFLDRCRAWYRPFAYKVVNWWLFEILSWCLSFAAFAAIVVILWKHDQQPLPVYPYGITLNGLLSTFVTLSKASLMVPVAAAIGQLKWTWFTRNEKCLQDFDTFDNASRGSWGSSKLIFQLKGLHIACIGAWLTIVSLAASPITQQTITYPQRSVLANGTGIAYQLLNFADPLFQTNLSAYGYDNTDVDSEGLAPYLAGNTLGAFWAGLYLPPTSQMPYLAPSCSTGNCTWPLYRSLAVCSSTHNLTNVAQTIHCVNTCVQDVCGDSCGITLPNGIDNFNYGGGILTLTPAEVSDIETDRIPKPRYNGSGKSIAFQDIHYPIANVFLLAPEGTTPNGSAYLLTFETIFYWCVEEYNTTVTNGQPLTVVTNSWNNATLESAAETSLPNVEGQTRSASWQLNISVPGDETPYVVSAFTSSAMTGQTQSFLNGTMHGYDFPAPYYQYTSDTMRVLYTTQRAEDYTMPGYPTIMSNIARSVSNSIQSYGGAAPIVHGTALTTEAFILVRWYWLSLLTVLVLGSLGFLLLTIVHSKQRRTLPWKNSVAPVLHALSSDNFNALGPLKHPVDEEKEMEDLQVLLKRAHQGWELRSKL